MKFCNRSNTCWYLCIFLIVVLSLSMVSDYHIFGQIHDSFSMGNVTFDNDHYEITEDAVVTLTDEDMNFNGDIIDTVFIDMWSDSDSAGINLSLVETGTSTGTFTGVVRFTATDSSSGQRLRVAPGDHITARYEDQTTDGLRTVTAVSQISGGVIEQVQTVRLENIRAVDSFGNPIEKVYVDKQVMISADVTSLTQSEQSYNFVLRINDKSGKTVQESEWTDVSLRPFQTLNNALSWTPTASGRYTATVSVVDKTLNGIDLADPLSLVVMVAEIEPSNRSPTAIISAAGSMKVGKQVEFSASKSHDPDGTIMSYQWNFGDGVSKTGKTVTHTYSQLGDYIVKLTVTDDEKSSATDELLVTISPDQQPIAVISGSQEAKIASTVTLSADQSYDPDGGDIKKYAWDLRDGRILEGRQISFSYSNAGQYDVILTVTDDENNLSQTTLPITVKSDTIPVEVMATAGGGGVAAATVVALTQIPKPIPKPTPPPNVTLSVRVRNPRIEIG